MSKRKVDSVIGFIKMAAEPSCNFEYVSCLIEPDRHSEGVWGSKEEKEKISTLFLRNLAMDIRVLSFNLFCYFYLVIFSH
jgi:hypothetical protein